MLGVVSDTDGTDVGGIVQDDVFVVLGVSFGWTWRPNVMREKNKPKEVCCVLWIDKVDARGDPTFVLRRSIGLWYGQTGAETFKHQYDVAVFLAWNMTRCSDLQLANLTAENRIAARGADLLMGAALKAVLATAVRRRAATILLKGSVDDRKAGRN